MVDKRDAFSINDAVSGVGDTRTVIPSCSNRSLVRAISPAPAKTRITSTACAGKVSNPEKNSLRLESEASHTLTPCARIRSKGAEFKI
ncbi:MAG: hypothetical protein ACE5LC_02160 [Candidatus Aminicenantales bacterium]